MKKVCLITPSHIASNPRLVKEAASLTENGYAVHLVFTQNLPWLARHDEHLLCQNPNWTYDVLDVNRNKITQKLRALLQKILPLFTLLFPSWKAILINRNFAWQLHRAIHHKADLYIAHNLGALPVAVLAAKKNGAKCGFDAEDFHRHETADASQHSAVRLKIYIEEKYLPKTDYITAASPMIAEQYQQLFSKPVVPLLNVFEKTPVKKAYAKTGVVRIIWFSQTIGPNRGLEIVIEAINRINEHKIELHLLGQIDLSFGFILQKLAKGFEKYGHGLHFHSSVSPEKVFDRVIQADLGIASETGFSINNNFALSNKLFTYIQCGLPVLLSDTDAQTNFFIEHPSIGKLYCKNDAQSLSQAILHYAKNRNEIAETGLQNVQLGKHVFNWELESQKFLSVINQVLPS